MDWVRHHAPLPRQVRWVMAHELIRLETTMDMIREVEAQMESLAASDPMILRLRELKGIGLITAVTLRASIGRFDRFRTGKQLARFCGLSPRNASSGQRQADAGLIHACDSSLRAVLIEAAHRLIRLEPRWADLARSMRQRGKPMSLVIAAVANRWMRWLFHQIQPLGLAMAA